MLIASKFVHLLALVLTATLGLAAAAQNQVLRKDWNYTSNHGNLLISVVSAPSEYGDFSTTLKLTPSGTWTVAQEAACLGSVLDALPDAGFEIRNLSSISLHFGEKDARQSVASQAARSKVWRLVLKSKDDEQIDNLVLTFMNESGAYEAWNTVFNQHGLVLKAAALENLKLSPIEDTDFVCPAHATCDKLIVPTDGFVQMSITPLVPQ